MKKTTLPLFGVLLIALGILSGCASIVDGGKTENVQITTTPLGANITVTDNRSGQTVFTGTSPASVALNRSAGFFKGVSYTIHISKEGYRAQSLQIQSTVNGWYFGNIIFGGLARTSQTGPIRMRVIPVLVR